MTAITLSEDQEAALHSFVAFLADSTETVFVIEGYSGTGKTTLVRTLIDQLSKLLQMARLINAKIPHYSVELTATTNKAAEVLAQVTGMSVSTIHSFLGLRVQSDYQTGETTLVPTKQLPPEGCLLFIDEASYIDKTLLGFIFSRTKNCKIVFMGDPAQLTPVKSQDTPVFNANFAKARLTKVMRQAEGNPIIALSTQFRETVENGEFFSFSPDGQVIQYLGRDDFNAAVVREFTRPDWRYQDSKVLAWTNKRVIEYNHFIRDQVLGDPNFQVDDYAVCNKFIQTGDRRSIKTDQMVRISGIMPGDRHGIDGFDVELDSCHHVFFPSSLEQKKKFIQACRAEGDYRRADEAENRWIDLRAAYACTINKAQGSTFDRVYIDLDDIRRCNSGDQIARMLYVGVSRARYGVIFTGDLV